MQDVVGGYIEARYPFSDYVALICNEEGKINGLPYNRALFEEGTRNIYDVIAGTFFICYAPPEAESFQSLPSELAEKYMEYYRNPQMFLRVNGKLLCVDNPVADMDNTFSAPKESLDNLTEKAVTQAQQLNSEALRNNPIEKQNDKNSPAFDNR